MLNTFFSTFKYAICCSVESMDSIFKSAEHATVSFNSVDFHYKRRWCKKKNKYVNLEIWIEDNFTARTYSLNYAVVKLWHGKVSSNFCDKQIVLSLNSCLRFEFESNEFQKLSLLLLKLIEFSKV